MNGLDSPELTLLHALRVKGAATPDALAQATGIDDVEAQVESLVADGLATRAEGSGYVALTPEGRERDAESIAEVLTDEDRAAFAATYDERFIPLNVGFKALCAAWQLEGPDFERLERVLAIHAGIEAILADAASHGRRFERYAERLTAALDRVQDGDADALTGPLGETYHNVWFELHEDLIATLGRTRADESA